MKPIVPIVLLLSALLSGCFRDSEKARSADAVRREALELYARNQNLLHQAEQAAFRAEARAHALTKWKQDIEQLQRTADADGKLNAAEAAAWVLRVSTALEKNYDTVDQQTAALRAAVESADQDLRLALKLDELLKQVHAKGFDPNLVSKAIETIKTLSGGKNVQTE